MIRTTLLWLFVTSVSVYAWRDWFKATCGLILLMAVIQHPDMPKSLLGVPGLNPWNVALASVTAAWLLDRKRKGLTWDLPPRVAMLAGLYMAVLFVASIRMIVDREYLDETTAYLVGEHFINVFKWVLPPLILFDGCRSRKQLNIALFSVLAVYFLLAVQVIRWVPLTSAMDGATLEARAHKIISNEIGYHRVNMSMMLAGASWAIFAARVAATRLPMQMFLVLGSATVLLGQSLTAGRTGYATWGVVGLALCLIRWKRYLLLAPVAAAAVVILVPGVSERMLQGFSADTVDTNARIDSEKAEEVAVDFDSEQEPDLYTITSGRNFAWPFVIEKIWERPLIGYGKLAMRRTGVTKMLMETYGENFPHPHNAYLELLFDAGIVGFVVVIPFYVLMLYRSLALFADSRSPAFIATGGAAAALTFALLVAALGSQSFYPREGSIGMWAAMALMLRVWVQRQRADATAGSLDAAAPAVSANDAIPRILTARSVPAPGRGPTPLVIKRGSISRPVRVPSRPSTRTLASRRTQHVDKYLWNTAA
jgi:O-antigen ligase